MYTFVFMWNRYLHLASKLALELSKLSVFDIYGRHVQIFAQAVISSGTNHTHTHQ